VATSLVAIALARGIAVTVPSAVASMAAVASVLSEGLLVAPIARGPVVALGLPGFGEIV